MEKKPISLRICISSFVSFYGKQKRIVEKKSVHRLAVYDNVRMTKVPNEASLTTSRTIKYIIGGSRTSYCPSVLRKSNR